MSEFNDELFQKTLGKHLMQVREKHNISRRQLAFEINVDEKQLRRLESGPFNSGLKLIGRIARVLHIRPSELFDFDLPRIGDLGDNKQEADFPAAE